MELSKLNRENLSKKITEGAVLLHGNNTVYRNNDVAFDFRQDSNFHYLTAWPEPFAHCLLYTSPSPRDGRISRMPSSA